MIASILAALLLLQEPARVPATVAGAVDSIRTSAVVPAPAVPAVPDGAVRPSAVDSGVAAIDVPVVVAPVDVAPAPVLLLARPLPPTLAPAAQPGVTRPKAVEMSRGYETRLKIHRWASYTMLPLFIGQYILGDKLLDNRENAENGGEFEDEGSTQDLHSAVAGGVAALFAVNTVTGVWNLWESRHVAEGRGKRIAHTTLMLAAEAGFVATGILAGEASEGDDNDATTHRNVALVSMGLATAGASLMWFWKD
jgi:hypothetical protein